MGQTGFFDYENRLKSLDKMGDPLVNLNQIVPGKSSKLFTQSITQLGTQKRGGTTNL